MSDSDWDDWDEDDLDYEDEEDTQFDRQPSYAVLSEEDIAAR